MNSARNVLIAVSVFVVVVLGSCDGPVEQWSKEVKSLENQLKDAEAKIEQLERAELMHQYRYMRLAGGGIFSLAEQALLQKKTIGELFEELAREGEKLAQQTEELEAVSKLILDHC